MKVGMLCCVKKSVSSIMDSIIAFAMPLEMVGPGWSISLSPHEMRIASKCGCSCGMFV